MKGLLRRTVKIHENFLFETAKEVSGISRILVCNSEGIKIVFLISKCTFWFFVSLLDLQYLFWSKTGLGMIRSNQTDTKSRHHWNENMRGAISS